MGTILSILDFIVLLLLALGVLRAVWKELRQGPGSSLLTICVALALVVLAVVSFGAYVGLVEAVSSLAQGIFLVILLVMAALLRFSWTGKTTS
jgi:hypothetical protein